MRVWSLGSGSSGNALVVECGTERVLVDCGFGPRALATRLRAVDIAPESISALLLTHEHVDHAQGALRAQHKWRWPVVATPGTLDALGGLPARWRRDLRPGAGLAVGDFTITSVRVPHDAADPAAFLVEHRPSGCRMGVAHDLGEVPAPLRTAFTDLDLLCVEANHDTQMLRDGPYPPRLQERIRGTHGHLSNEQTASWLRDALGQATRQVFLLHLSEQNNAPEVAERTVRAGLRGTAFRGVVRAAPRRTPTLLTSGPASAAHAPVQLAFGL